MTQAPRIFLARTGSHLSRILRALATISILILTELRDISWMILLVSVGAGLITADLRPDSAWGVGMVVFGGLSLILRQRERERSRHYDPGP